MAYEIKKLEWKQNGDSYYLLPNSLSYIVIGGIVKAPEVEEYFLTIGILGFQFTWSDAGYPYPTPEAAMQKAQELYEQYAKTFLVEVPDTK